MGSFSRRSPGAVFRWGAMLSAASVGVLLASAPGAAADVIPAPTLTVNAQYPVQFAGAISATVRATPATAPAGAIEGDLLGPVPPEDGSCVGLDWSSAPVAWSQPSVDVATETGNMAQFTADEQTAAGCYTWSLKWTMRGNTNNTSTSTPGQLGSTTMVIDPAVKGGKTSASPVDAAGPVRVSADVTGTGGAPGVLTGVLRGPADPVDGKCGGVDFTSVPAAGTATRSTSGDGNYTTGDVTVRKPGCYVWELSWRSAQNKQVSVDESDPSATDEAALILNPALRVASTARPVDRLGTVRGRFTVTGTLKQPGTLEGTMFGPVRPLSGTCAGVDWSGAQASLFTPVPTVGDGQYRSARVRATGAGCYTWQVKWTADANHDVQVVSAAGRSGDTALHLSPKLTASGSAHPVSEAGPMFATVSIVGSHGQNGKINGVLLGPVDPVGGSCTAADWGHAPEAGSIPEIKTTGDTTVNTASLTVKDPGCYTWHLVWQSDANHHVYATVSSGGAATTTALLAPKLVAETSAEDVTGAGTIRAKFTVTGTAGQPGTISGQLVGPVPPRGGSCADVNFSSAASVAIKSLPASGDKKYTSSGIGAEKPGCYTWSGTWTADDNADVTGHLKPGSRAATSLLLAPSVTVTPSGQPVDGGGKVHAVIDVAGTGGQPGKVTGKLLGPVDPVGGSCVGVNFSSAPVAGSITPITTTSDGTVTTSGTNVDKPGCYTFAAGWTAAKNRTVKTEFTTGSSGSASAFKVESETASASAPAAAKPAPDSRPGVWMTAGLPGWGGPDVMLTIIGVLLLAAGVGAAAFIGGRRIRRRHAIADTTDLAGVLEDVDGDGDE